MKLTNLVAGVLLLPLILFMGSCGNNEEKKTLTKKSGYFFYVQKDYSKEKDKQISLNLFNPAEGNRVIDEGGKIKDKRDPESGEWYYSEGIGKFTLLSDITFKNGGTSFTYNGSDGIVYVKDGKLYYYAPGKNPEEIKAVGKISRLRKISDLPDKAQIRILTENSYRDYYIDPVSGNKILRYDEDTDFRGYLKTIVVGTQVKGYLYEYYPEPGTYSRWRYYDYSFSTSAEITSLDGYKFFGQDPDNLYFGKNIINEEGKYFSLEMVFINKEDLPGSTLNFIKKDGSNYKYELEFKYAVGISDETDVIYIFSNGYLYMGSIINAGDLDNWKCVSEDKTKCYYFYALHYNSSDDTYEVIRYTGISHWRSSIYGNPLENPELKFTSSKGMFLKLTKYFEQQNDTVRGFSIDRILNGEVKHVIVFKSSDLSDAGKIRNSSVRINLGGIINNDLYYSIRGRFDVEYDGDPKPFPAHFDFNKTWPMASPVERGEVSYNSDYEYCEGGYFVYSDGTTEVRNVQCYFDENKNGLFDDADDIECYDDNNNQSFDSGECDYVNSGSFHKLYICSTPTNQEENSICTNEIFEFVGYSGATNSHFLNGMVVIGSGWIPYIYDLRTGKEFNHTTFEYDFISNGIAEGFYTGWFITFDSLGFAFYDKDYNKSLFSFEDLNRDPDEYIEISFSLSKNTIGVLTHKYPYEKYFPYTEGYTEAYALYILQGNSMQKGFEIESVSDGQHKAKEVELLTSFWD